MFPTLDLGHPLALGLLALAFPAIALIPRRRLRATASGARRGVLLVRALLLTSLVLALAEPVASPPGRARAVVFALDVSDSMTPQQLAWARAWVDRAIASLPSGSRWSIEEFADRAQIAGPEGVPTTAVPTIATNVEAALRLAGPLLPREPSYAPEIVLLTDGWDTVSANTAGIADAAAAGVAVSFVMPPVPTDARPVAVRSIDLPPALRVGEMLEASIEVEALAATDTRFRLWLDGVLVVDRMVVLDEGSNQVGFARRLQTVGFHEVRVEMAVDDSRSTLTAVTLAKEAGRALLLEDEPNVGDGLAELLEREGVAVERAAATSLPPNANELEHFDAIVLVNTPATSLKLDQQRTLQAFVQDLGRGLLVVGGSRAYAPGAYEGSVLDDLLPVAAQPPIEPQQGTLALFLVIDRSGSMEVVSSGTSKISMAREAAIQAAALLQPNDTLGVVAFDSGYQWIVPPVKLRNSEDVRQAQSRIGGIRSGGGTSILPPLEAAYEAASQSDAPLKHVVLLTDGESTEGGYDALIERMRPVQVTLSTLAIGSDSDTRLLSSLARMGGGRYYFTERGSQIPKIASKETTILTRNAVIEGRIAAIVAEPSPVLRMLSGDFPALRGYVATSRKERAVTALETERGHPLLAHWQYGLGRVVAWTSEAQRGWAGEWAGWSEAARFWAQAVRWAMPAPQRADFQVSARVEPDGRRVVLHAQSLGDDGRFADLLDTRATVLYPDGTAREVTLPQRAPGTYELATRVDQPGAYRVLFSQRQEGQVVREDLAAFATPDSAELHSVGINRGLLEQLARRTGGRELREPTDLVRSDRASGSAGPPIPLWPWLLGLALAVLPVDILLRRRV